VFNEEDHAAVHTKYLVAFPIPTDRDGAGETNCGTLRGTQDTADIEDRGTEEATEEEAIGIATIEASGIDIWPCGPAVSPSN
jgi:hypothetical protein